MSLRPVQGLDEGALRGPVLVFLVGVVLRLPVAERDPTEVAAHPIRRADVEESTLGQVVRRLLHHLQGPASEGRNPEGDKDKVPAT